TVSRESAFRSSMNFASGNTSSGRTPRLSQMISFTRSSTGLLINTSSGTLACRHRRVSRRAPSATLHVQSAVDVNDLAGDVPPAVPGQEPHDLGHLSRRSDPL